MISNGASDGEMYGISPFQQVKKANDFGWFCKEILFLGKNIYDTTIT
jgi:hypothetical protein